MNMKKAIETSCLKVEPLKENFTVSRFEIFKFQWASMFQGYKMLICMLVVKTKTRVFNILCQNKFFKFLQMRKYARSTPFFWKICSPCPLPLRYMSGQSCLPDDRFRHKQRTKRPRLSEESAEQIEPELNEISWNSIPNEEIPAVHGHVVFDFDQFDESDNAELINGEFDGNLDDLIINQSFSDSVNDTYPSNAEEEEENNETLS